MIGYCKPDREELRLKDIKKYSAYYCALCHTLSRKYGLLYRLLLSNDAVFLLICLDAMSGEKEVTTGRCPGNPLRKIQIPVNRHAAEYAAFINVYLVEHVLADHIQDAHHLIVRFFFKSLRCYVRISRGYRNDLKEHARLITELDAILNEVDQLEKSRAGFDDITNAFGILLDRITFGFEFFDHNEESVYLRIMMFNMGKWLYLADALDDYNKDVRSNAYNLLMTINTPPEGDQLEFYIEKSFVLLYMLQLKMIDAFEKIQWSNSKDIIQNIILDGPKAMLKTIIMRRFRKKSETSCS